MKTIKIQAPKANIGDIKNALNYRLHPKRWEVATVESITYSLKYKSWTYHVKLDRESKNGNPLRIEVGDDGIE